MSDLNLSSSLISINIEDEMQRSYLDYAMSVIVSRALPDVRDGLKPVHRRILYAMHESNCDYNKPYRKSARIVGEVMGKYHPHGDSAIYDSLVRMAQDFSLRLPLVDGQGNFGSMDGDSPAAMRYTESRLAEITHKLLEYLEEETVDFQPNYDGAELEPTVLPAQFPNLLVNGAGGIAVGMATNIPPHNLGEVIDGCCMFVEDNEVTIEQLGEVIKGPDFPTGGIILGYNGIKSALNSGRGSVIMRGKANIVENKDSRTAIIISEIPYQVNKARLVEKIAELVKDKRIEGISDLRDESDKDGVRVVVELKRDANAEILLNQLYSLTPLQTSFGVNMLALNHGRPELMNVKQVIQAFVEFREEVITKRTKFRLRKSRERAHILIGMAVAVANIDKVINMIKTAPDVQVARDRLLTEKWSAEELLPLLRLVGDTNISDNSIKLTEEQARAILDMKLQRLTGLEHQKIHDELNNIMENIKNYLEILESREVLLTLLKNELLEIKEKFANPRKTVIELNEFEQNIEELIPREDMVITITMGGYIKRVPLATYRAQKRGGKGRSALSMHEEDVTKELIVSSTHQFLLLFTNTGKVYRTKVYKLPLGSPQSKGRAVINIFPLVENEHVSSVMLMPEEKEDWQDKSIIFATKQGLVKRNDLLDFENINANGKIAIRLDDNDQLMGVVLTNKDDHIMLASSDGRAARFAVDDLRVFKSRATSGVRGIKLKGNDHLISISVLIGVEIDDMFKRDHYLSIPLEDRLTKSTEQLMQYGNDQVLLEDIEYFAEREQFILTVTANGFGKRSSAFEYRITSRGAQGVTNIKTTARNGNVVASFTVNENDQILMITDQGKMIRIPVYGIRIIGRNSQGVKLFTTAENEHVVSVVRIEDDANNTTDETTEEVEQTEGGDV